MRHYERGSREQDKRGCLFMSSLLIGTPLILSFTIKDTGSVPLGITATAIFIGYVLYRDSKGKSIL